MLIAVLTSFALPGVVIGKITRKTLKESVSIEGTRKGKEEVLKLHLIPWQVVQESNPDTGIRVVLEVDGGLVLGVLVRQIKKCHGAYTSTKQVLVQTAKPVPPLGQYITEKAGPTNLKKLSFSSGLKYSSSAGLMQQLLAKGGSRWCLGWLSAFTGCLCAEYKPITIGDGSRSRPKRVVVHLLLRG